MEFVHRLIHTSSYDVKLDLIDTHVRVDVSLPCEQLTPESNENVHEHDDEYLDDSFDENLAKYDPREPTPINKGLDKGPKDAWQQAHFSLPWGAWVMLGEHAGRRKRAYVFWDLERLERFDLSRVFEGLSREEANPWTPSNEEQEQMERSWRERSKIWVRCGRGYWGEGDLSRIDWPDSILEAEDVAKAIEEVMAGRW